MTQPKSHYRHVAHLTNARRNWKAAVWAVNATDDADEVLIASGIMRSSE